LTRWGKACVFLNPKAGVYGFLNTQPDLSCYFSLSLSITEMEMLHPKYFFELRVNYDTISFKKGIQFPDLATNTYRK
jgi:hypothetical protein